MLRNVMPRLLWAARPTLKIDSVSRNWKNAHLYITSNMYDMATYHASAVMRNSDFFSSNVEERKKEDDLFFEDVLSSSGNEDSKFEFHKPRRNLDYKFDFNKNDKSFYESFDKDNAFDDQVNLQPILKQCYQEKSSYNEEEMEQINKFLNNNDIAIKGKHHQPIFKFKDAQLSEPTIRVLESKNFTHPTPIQSVCWPQTLSGNNVIGIAQTGSGKTLGFVAPGIEHILQNRKAQSVRVYGPRMLVLCPTRELAMQCSDVVRQFKECFISHACLYGGQDKTKQLWQLQKNPDIVVATPGRLLDLMQSGDVDISKCSYLVLDEADRMLDMGFKPQIDAIVKQIRPDRQVTMWSATWPIEIQKLAYSIVSDDYVHIKVGKGELTPSSTIEHFFRPVKNHRVKNHVLEETLQTVMEKDSQGKIVIFTRTKVQCQQLSYQLQRNLDLGPEVQDAIHGDKSQTSRTRVLDSFRSKNGIKILIATQVASRGLDIADVKFVINYDMPEIAEEYVHRVGRCGRSGNTGYAITLVSKMDMEKPSFAKTMINIKTLIANGGKQPPKDIDLILQAARGVARSFGSNSNKNRIRYDNKRNY